MKKNKLTTIYLKSLIDNYFEGKTTCEEEQILKEYFKGENIHEEYIIYKPLFMYFEGKQNLNNKNVPFTRYLTAIAATVLIFIGSLCIINNYSKNDLSNYVIINGSIHEDREVIKNAQRSS